MKTITKKEWTEKHGDYRSVINGQRYVLENVVNKGTCLVPVKVEGLQDLPTRIEALRTIAESDKAGNVDGVRVTPHVAATIVKWLDKKGEGVHNALADLPDWRGYIKDVTHTLSTTLH